MINPPRKASLTQKTKLKTDLNRITQMFVTKLVSEPTKWVMSKVCIYPIPPPWTGSWFLSQVQQIWIQSFPSPKLVATPRLKSPVCPTIHPELMGRIVGFIPFSMVLALCEMEAAFNSLCPFPITKNIIYVYVCGGVPICTGVWLGLMPYQPL